MDNSKQVEILKEVLELERQVANLKSKLLSLKSEKFTQPPKEPTCEKIIRTYPKIKSQIKFNWIKACLPIIVTFVLSFEPMLFALLFFPALLWIPIYYFVFHRKYQKEDKEKIKNSDEYKAQCAKLDEEFDKQQNEANERYKKEKEIYDTKTLPEYQEKLKEWEAEHDQKVKETKIELMNAHKKLTAIYEETKIVPMQYREIEKLQYIYDLISTSDYDIKQAIDVYDRNEQRRLDEARLYEQQYANQIADEQNDLLNEQNRISERARKDANRAAIVGAVQRHNTNKALKNLRKK